MSAEGTPLAELRDVDCGRCGVTLMKDGEMQSIGFMVPQEPVIADIRCEDCARKEGLWSDE